MNTTNLKEPKVFTLEEARETLPYVRKILADIMEAHADIEKLNREIQVTSDLEDRRYKMFEKELRKQRMEEFQQELEFVGCHLKNPQEGIIGYYWDPGDGFVAELCWKHGEHDIAYWQQIGHDELMPLSKMPPHV